MATVRLKDKLIPDRPRHLQDGAWDVGVRHLGEGPARTIGRPAGVHRAPLPGRRDDAGGIVVREWEVEDVVEDATLAADMCPRCKSDNTACLALCAKCENEIIDEWRGMLRAANDQLNFGDPAPVEAWALRVTRALLQQHKPHVFNDEPDEVVCLADRCSWPCEEYSFIEMEMRRGE